MKKQKVTSNKNLNFIRKQSCEVCNAPPLSDAHHYKSKGSGGDDRMTNLISLCRTCHQNFHSQGVLTWSKKHLNKVNGMRILRDIPLIKQSPKLNLKVSHKKEE